VTDPRKLESAETDWKRVRCTAIGCESGRQDSNLRPLVPQTSPYFPIRIEFELEGFRREMVGMTSRPCFLESVRIASTSTGALKAEADGTPPRSTLLSMSIVHAELTAGASAP
jgi:hypothetical protein